MLPTFVLALALVVLQTLRLRTYLQPFQQEEYNGHRFLLWWVEKHAWDHRASFGLLLVMVLALPLGWFSGWPVYAVAATVWLLLAAHVEPNPEKEGKKLLVLTTRARNIWLLATLLTSLVSSVALFLVPSPLLKSLLVLLMLQVTPFYLLIANQLLSPVQRYENKRFVAEARAVLQRLNPTVVGMTGSFGKTSTKYLLNHILSASAPTLMTPGSVNTPLGIARIVREQLLPQHRFFLAEMGAYGPGSIARLCRLAPPHISCITAVGEAHYERFRSVANVAEAKFEIARATHANGGVCVLAADGIPEGHWRPRVERNRAGYRIVSTHPASADGDGDYLIAHATQTQEGLTITMRHKGEDTVFTAPLFGPTQIGNIGVAFALAVELGVPKKVIATAMRTLPTAPHRLNIRREGPMTVIDDSYNSNPGGFAAALEVLSLLASPQKDEKAEKTGKGKSVRKDAEPVKRRRILITPGMVELGAKHDEEHARIGELAADHADIIVAVNPSRIPTFVQAAKKARARVVEAATLAEARAWLAKNGKEGDIVLLENDLPDRYESRWTL